MRAAQPPPTLLLLLCACCALLSLARTALAGSCSQRTELSVASGSRHVLTDGDGIYDALMQCEWLFSGTRHGDPRAGLFSRPWARLAVVSAPLPCPPAAPLAAHTPPSAHHTPSALHPAVANDTVLRVAFHSYATECQYDYLFIYGGASYQSPLLAAYSGDYPPDDLYLDLPEVGKAAAAATPAPRSYPPSARPRLSGPLSFFSATGDHPLLFGHQLPAGRL